MFTNLYFKMENSIGVPVSVNLRNKDGVIFYKIGFQEEEGEKEQSLSHKNSKDLLKKIERSRIVEAVSLFDHYGLNEGGSGWSFHIESSLGVSDISGPMNSRAVIMPQILSYAELLDDVFQITRFVKNNRLDRVEVEFTFDELRDQVVAGAENVSFDHKEFIVLDRDLRTIDYTRVFPAFGFKGHIQCCCDDDVSVFLDETEKILENEELLQSTMVDDESPVLRFTFTFHDGSTACVVRNMSKASLSDGVYTEMLDVIWENIQKLMFRMGVFDNTILDKAVRFP